MKTKVLILAGITLSASLIFMGCKKDETTSTPTPVVVQPSIYDQLGGTVTGQANIAAVVDEFINIVALDTVINSFFTNPTNGGFDHLKQELRDQICYVTGGPCVYTGKTMKDAHKGMNIRDIHFNALVGDLQMALKKKGVSDDLVTQITALLAPTHDDIVNTTATGTLYERLGGYNNGQRNIKVVVEEFINIVAADDSINTFFSNPTGGDFEHLKKQLVDQITNASGGPFVYAGKSMQEAHKGMNIQEKHFNALVADLGKAMANKGVGQKEIDDLVAALGPLKSQIVGQ